MSRHKSWYQCTYAERIERWENVLRVGKALTPHEQRKHFNMSTWLDKTDCGTTGCMAGFCALDPWFRRRGFGAKFVGRDHEFQFAGMSPGQFFGNDGNENIFINPAFVQKRGIGIYRVVMAEVKFHIKALKDKARDAKIAEAAERQM